MANIKNLFYKGRMNKSLDKRVIQEGEYIDALNVRVNSSEGGEQAVIENSLGNEQLTTITYAGYPLTENAKTIGKIEDPSNNTIYWFIHDENNEHSVDTGKVDLIVSLNVASNILTYHVISINDGGGVDTVLNFDNQHLITGINKIGDMIFWVNGQQNPPRKINVKRKYAQPVAGVDGFTEEEIAVIKRPPLYPPNIEPVTTQSGDKFIKERFISFAYRYKYADGEYSATSDWSKPAFIPNNFEFNLDSYLNEGMTNFADTVKVTYNSGSNLVKEIDILFKDNVSNVIKVAERLNKKNFPLNDDTDYQYIFNNSKIYTILPDSELLRLYDNVPRYAGAQTIIGNRLVYGEYMDGYDLEDSDGLPVKMIYSIDLLSQYPGSADIATTFNNNSTYSIDYSVSKPNTLLSMDLSPYKYNLKNGAELQFTITFGHGSFSSHTPAETTPSTSLIFNFFLPRDYTSVYDLGTSQEFLNAIGTLTPSPNFNPMATACSGATLTDQFNCILPDELDGWYKYDSGISGVYEPVKATASASSDYIYIQLPAGVFGNDPVTPTSYAYEYYAITSASALFSVAGSIESLHSNRGYEVAMLYRDGYKRQTTALVSTDNNIHVPAYASTTKNSIKVTIPVTQKPPAWATNYTFAIKADKEGYDTIYSNIYFKDPATDYTYFMLEGENARKVEKGDRLIVKADSTGALTSVKYLTILEKEAYAVKEINEALGLPVVAGVYMKAKAGDISAIEDSDAVIDMGLKSVTQSSGNHFAVIAYPLFNSSGSYSVAKGARITLDFKFERKGFGDGNSSSCPMRRYTFKRTFVASADYTDIRGWWNGDNIGGVIGTGVSEAGSNDPIPENEYKSTFPNPFDFNTDLWLSQWTNYYQFGIIGGELCLILSGGKTCFGVGDGRKSTITARITMVKPSAALIFETEPTDTLPDVWYISPEVYDIDEEGNHLGGAGDTDQDINGGIAGVITLPLFNCYTFGNGAESYKINDSIVGKQLALGNQVTAVSAQDYKEADRFADYTYSGVYNNETNVNKLNEFNLGLLNFGSLDKSFGRIRILDGRETDMFVLQQDKISYVLVGKNLLTDATGESSITSVPEVFGKQVARVEEYGISDNPESYVAWGGNRFFTDAKRGAIIQISGNSAQGDAIGIISLMGMQYWFRELFMNSGDTQKIGGYDPYMGEYVLSSNATPIPAPEVCDDCGITKVFSLDRDTIIDWCVDVGTNIGISEISYSGNNAALYITYNGSTDSTDIGYGSPYLLNKTEMYDTTVHLQLVGKEDDTSVTVSVECIVPNELTVMQVCVTNNADAGDFIHNEWSWEYGGIPSAITSNLVEFDNGSGLIVSQYQYISGEQGVGGIPIDDSTVTMYCKSKGFDNFVFNPVSHSFKWLRSDTLYTAGDVATLLGLASTETTISTGAPAEYHATLDLTGSSGNILYLIYDYRNSTALDLCYDTNSSAVACCDCVI